MVVSEVALSLVLLSGAGLMMRSLLALQSVDPGINPQNVLTFQISIPNTRYAQPQQVTAFYQRLEERLKAVPGVQSVATTSRIPVGGPGFGLGRVFLREGAPEPPAGADTPAQWNVITPGYFNMMGIPLVKGRGFNEQDTGDSNPVIIISQHMAKRMFPNEDPLGKRIRSWRDENKLREIVGIVGDVRYFGLDDSERVAIYVPHQQDAWRSLVIAARTAADPMSFARAARDEVRMMDKDLVVSNPQTMERIVANSISGQRFTAVLLGIFAVVALSLAAVGIYGVMSYVVTQRTNEIGIRMALGAEPRDILGLVAGQGLKLAVIGVALGLIGAFAATRALSVLLYGVSPTDAVTLASIALLLVMVALLACYIPARRAAKVDPMVALRCE
jgi:putative ABC transport system permease protein